MVNLVRLKFRIEIGSTPPHSHNSPTNFAKRNLSSRRRVKKCLCVEAQDDVRRQQTRGGNN